MRRICKGCGMPFDARSARLYCPREECVIIRRAERLAYCRAHRKESYAAQKVQYPPRVCERCGDTFTPRSKKNRGVVCAKDACKSWDWKRRNREQSNAYQGAYQKAKRQAAKPKGRTCKACGAPIPDEANAAKQYCGNTCVAAGLRRKNPERVAARLKAWKQANRDRVRELNRRYADAHPEEERERYQAAWIRRQRRKTEMQFLALSALLQEKLKCQE